MIKSRLLKITGIFLVFLGVILILVFLHRSIDRKNIKQVGTFDNGKIITMRKGEQIHLLLPLSSSMKQSLSYDKSLFQEIKSFSYNPKGKFFTAVLLVIGRKAVTTIAVESKPICKAGMMCAQFIVQSFLVHVDIL